MRRLDRPVSFALGATAAGKQMGCEGILCRIVDFGGVPENYPVQLGACMVLWLLLLLIPGANRVSTFVFSFSAWFAVLWAVILLSFASFDSPEHLDRSKLVFLAAMAVPMAMFGFCALSALFSVKLVQTIDAESSRAVRLIGFLLVTHVVHFALMFTLYAFATG